MSKEFKERMKREGEEIAAHAAGILAKELLKLAVSLIRKRKVKRKRKKVKKK